MKRLLLFPLLISALLAAEPAPTTYTVAVVPMGTTHEYWKAIHAGALKAQEELRASGTAVEIIWKGPLREDDRDQQIQVIENFTGRHVSGIVLAPLDARALARPVEAAVAAGIPVVVVDSGLQSRAPASFIATDNRAGGRLAAQRLGTLLKGEGNVILLRVQAGAASSEERERGFLEEMQSKFPKIRILSSNNYGGATRDTAMGVSQNLLNRYGTAVDGIFTPNESTTAGMMLALNAAGLGHSKVKLVGFANSQLFIDALRKGELQGLVMQDPFRMGYLGVKSVIAAARGEKIPSKVITDVVMATPDNLNDRAVTALLPQGK
ncbi:MAG: substrate-binding domain-containing protein [Verrucomicrobia bacterium]|nr:substrate-binding domain-containing protein [Verrucomicrobiota bacterium]